MADDDPRRRGRCRRSIDEDHYGMTIFAAPAEDELSTAARGLLARRPGLAREDHVTYRRAELRALLERFVAAGASKFVVFPIAADPDPWLRELHTEAIVAVET